MHRKCIRCCQKDAGKDNYSTYKRSAMVETVILLGPNFVNNKPLASVLINEEA